MGCSLVLRQLRLLLWKNFILQLRRPIGTACEMIVPLLALAVMLGSRQMRGVYVTHTCFTTFQSNYLQVPQTYGTVYYTPSNIYTDHVMEIAQEEWPQLRGKLIPVADQEEMIEVIENTAGLCSQFGNAGSAGVCFDNLNDSKDIRYTLRFPYEQNWYTSKKAGASDVNKANTESSYMTYGFINVQRIIEKSIITFLAEKHGADLTNIDVSMRQFPYPDTSQDPFLQSLYFALPLLLTVSFIYTAATITKAKDIAHGTTFPDAYYLH